MAKPDHVYLLLADGDGTMRSQPEPWAAVFTAEEAQRYVDECEAPDAKQRIGYPNTHTLRKVRIFNTWEEAREAVYGKK